jgi:hypothetical protein
VIQHALKRLLSVLGTALRQPGCRAGFIQTKFILKSLRGTANCFYRQESYFYNTMIRLIRLATYFLLFFPLLVSAQSPLDYTAMGNARQLSFGRQQTSGIHKQLARNWQLSSFAGISGSYGFFNRTNAALISAPVTMQLSHQLNRNLYAFAAVTAAPAYSNFGNFFLNAPTNKFTSANMMSGVNRFGWYSRAEAGLFYINDEKTFSISGSIYMDRSSYPVYSPYTPQHTQFNSR